MQRVLFIVGFLRKKPDKSALQNLVSDQLQLQSWQHEQLQNVCLRNLGM